MNRPALTIREFDDSLAGIFHNINATWIAEMFTLEPTDREVLENPRSRIIDPGGAILFVEAEGLGIVGTCALQKTGAHAFELTKMGVRESARGLKAGESLLAATIDRRGSSKPRSFTSSPTTSARRRSTSTKRRASSMTQRSCATMARATPGAMWRCGLRVKLEQTYCHFRPDHE